MPAIRAEARPSLALDPVHDRVDGLHVVRFEAAPEGVGEHLLGQAAVEVAAVPVDQDAASAPGRPGTIRP